MLCILVLLSVLQSLTASAVLYAAFALVLFLALLPALELFQQVFGSKSAAHPRCSAPHAGQEAATV